MRPSVPVTAYGRKSTVSV